MSERLAYYSTQRLAHRLNITSSLTNSNKHLERLAFCNFTYSYVSITKWRMLLDGYGREPVGPDGLLKIRTRNITTANSAPHNRYVSVILLSFTTRENLTLLRSVSICSYPLTSHVPRLSICSVHICYRSRTRQVNRFAYCVIYMQLKCCLHPNMPLWADLVCCLVHCGHTRITPC